MIAQATPKFGIQPKRKQSEPVSMTLEYLNSCTRKALADLARVRGVDGWHAMRKSQLVRALLRVSRATTARKNDTSRKPAAARKPLRQTESQNGKARPEPVAVAKTGKPAKQNGHLKTLHLANGKNGKKITAVPGRAIATSPQSVKKSTNGPPASDRAPPRERDLCTVLPTEILVDDARKDRLVAAFCESHWMRVSWEVSRESVRRAEMRLRAEWHRAVPILRLHEVTFDEANCATESWVKDVEIQGGGNTWYIHVVPSARSYRVQIGYRTPSGVFFPLGRSNIANMAKQTARAVQMNETDLQSDAVEPAGKPVSSAARSFRIGRLFPASAMDRFGPGTEAARNHDQLTLDPNAELVLRGTTRAGTEVTIQGESVTVREDGGFTVRVLQPEGRQVVSLVAVSPNGGERRTIVIAVDRNIKELETQYFDEFQVDNLNG